jgi:hypothetical protein
MNPDAAIADTGEKMEAYYDEKLKRWIFPGDDPNEVAKPLAPPPVISVKKDNGNIISAQTPAKNNDDDPLAALMAPPVGRTPDRAIGSSGDPLKDLMAPPRASHFSEPRKQAGASRAASRNMPSSARKPPLSAAASGKPPAPHFVIFQPTTATASDE